MAGVQEKSGEKIDSIVWVNGEGPAARTWHLQMNLEL